MVPFVQLIRLAIWLRLLLHVAPRSGFNGNLLNDANHVRATATIHPSQHQFTARSRNHDVHSFCQESLSLYGDRNATLGDTLSYATLALLPCEVDEAFFRPIAEP